MVMRVRFALALALWATFQSAASPVAVNARTPSPVVLNVGPSCAEWLETRQAPYSIYEGYNEGFIVGVLNGMSIGDGSGVSLSLRNPGKVRYVVSRCIIGWTSIAESIL